MHLSENQRVAALYFHLSELSEVERPPEKLPCIPHEGAMEMCRNPHQRRLLTLS